MLETQKRENYKNEYDRLKGAMLSGLVTETNKKYIDQRLGKLKDLARESVNGKTTRGFLCPRNMMKKQTKKRQLKINEDNQEKVQRKI